MVFTENNKSICINVISYQYPEEKSSIDSYNHDANWLICEIKYNEGEFSQSYTDPCLLTYELEELIAALSKILNGDDSGYISDFLEPYLQISIGRANDKIMFVVHYMYDTLDSNYEKLKVTSLVEKEYAIQILDELKKIQKIFPKR